MPSSDVSSPPSTPQLRVSHALGPAHERLRDGRWAPPAWEVHASIGGVTVRLSVSVERGLPVVVECALRRVPGGPPVSTAALRSVPVARLLDQSTATVALEAVGDASFEPPLSSEVVARRAPRSRPGERGELLERVAATYRQAVSAGDRAPRQAVSAELGYSPAYVAQLLVEARRKGVLEPAPGGRAPRP